MGSPYPRVFRSTLHVWSCVILTTALESLVLLIPILQMRKLRHRGWETFLGSESQSVMDLRAAREPGEGVDDTLQEAGGSS